MHYCPFRHFPQRASPLGFVRLACLIHAANVRSEPGSNPSKVSSCQPEPKLGRSIDEKGLTVAMQAKLKTRTIRLAPPHAGCVSPNGDEHILVRLNNNWATGLSKTSSLPPLESGGEARDSLGDELASPPERWRDSRTIGTRCASVNRPAEKRGARPSAYTSQ